MKTYPLESISIEEALQFQFQLVDCITREFDGAEFLKNGDLGLTEGFNKPETTFKVEKIIASFFGVESAIFVRGAGTGAIRYALFSAVKSGQTLLVHKAPIYSTTKTSIEMSGLKTVEADFNNPSEIENIIKANPHIAAALIQYTRQKPDDSYDIKAVISKIKQLKDIPIISDDNYAVMKVKKIGAQCGADLSCFSSFKLLGPEGIGIIAGKKKYIDIISKTLYSGGSQTQGFEALEALRGLVYAPAALAVSAKVSGEVLKRLNSGEIPEVKNAFIANAQSKVLIVEFKENIAKEVLQKSQKSGAAPRPVGAESKYEIVPMFYRVSGTFRMSDPKIEERMIRINPMRAGADTIIRILKEACV
ncbi:MAG: aminotransferase class V-fold PLP-dependent enzyme [Elusimicrobiota bacterium]|jgi:cystathionine beta-lyase/cystathionine gamma-synthase|nr:aminotransferase class V-fold PLP-dependent enzyme [Elusimicrobiota bacterium]